MRLIPLASIASAITCDRRNDSASSLNSGVLASSSNKLPYAITWSVKLRATLLELPSHTLCAIHHIVGNGTIPFVEAEKQHVTALG